MTEILIPILVFIFLGIPIIICLIMVYIIAMVKLWEAMVELWEDVITPIYYGLKDRVNAFFIKMN